MGFDRPLFDGFVEKMSKRAKERNGIYLDVTCILVRIRGRNKVEIASNDRVVTIFIFSILFILFLIRVLPFAAAKAHFLLKAANLRRTMELLSKAELTFIFFDQHRLKKFIRQ